MICSEARELLSLYIDNMLEEEQRMEVEKHLLTCDECKKELDSLIFITKMLNDLPEVELPELFDDRLREKLLLANKLTKKKKWSRYSSFAAIFLIGIFSVAMYNNMNADVADKSKAMDPAATMMKTTTEPEMLVKSAVPDEEMIPYIKLLDDLYKDQKYILTDWTLEPTQGYIINIELETSDEMGTVSYERLSYRGQDGKLCKIE